jgi:hypothetical protein
MINVSTIGDITGDNAKHQITASAVNARWVKFSATGGTARVGDTNVGAARGVNVPQNGTVEFPMSLNEFDVYVLPQIYAYVPSGSTLQISYGGA